MSRLVVLACLVVAVACVAPSEYQQSVLALERAVAEADAVLRQHGMMEPPSAVVPLHEAPRFAVASNHSNSTNSTVVLHKFAELVPQINQSSQQQPQQPQSQSQQQSNSSAPPEKVYANSVIYDGGPVHPGPELIRPTVPHAADLKLDLNNPHLITPLALITPVMDVRPGTLQFHKRAAAVLKQLSEDSIQRVSRQVKSNEQIVTNIENTPMDEPVKVVASVSVVAPTVAPPAATVSPVVTPSVTFVSTPTPAPTPAPVAAFQPLQPLPVPPVASLSDTLDLVGTLPPNLKRRGLASLKMGTSWLAVGDNDAAAAAAGGDY